MASSVALAIDIYEVLRKEADDTANLKRFIAEHIARGSCFTIMDGESIAGVAFVWNIEDPMEVRLKHGYPGENGGGKYLFFPFIYVVPKHRNGFVLKKLLVHCFSRYPGATRMAFMRPKTRMTTKKRGRPKSPRDDGRLHVIELVKESA